MSMNYTEKEIKRFLESDTPTVLCIKGKWGTGKTFLWNKCFKDTLNQKTIKYEMYSYVSLFGIDNINEIKTAIFENTLTRDDFLARPSIETLGTTIDVTLSKSKKIQNITKIAEKIFKTPGVLEQCSQLGYLGINKQIICFDDFERSGKNLSTSDVLGLTTILKESKKCKIVFIVNENELDKDKLADFNKHIEKVSDQIINFQPTPSEAVKTALNPNNELLKDIQDNCEKLKISNIRLIKRIFELSTQVLKIIDSKHTTFNKECLKTICLGICAHFDPSNYPPIDFIRKYNDLNWYMDDTYKEAQKDPIQSKWIDLLEELAYQSTDSLDNEIFQCISRGYVIDNELLSKAKIVENAWIESNIDNPLTEAWRHLYHGSLSEDDDVVLNGIYTATKNHISRISVNGLNSSCRLLRENEHQEEADELIKLFIESNQHQPLAYWDVNNHSFVSQDEIDKGILSTLNEQYINFNDTRPIQTIVENICSGKISLEDYLSIGKLSTEEFEKIIYNLKGENLDGFIREVIKFNYRADNNAVRAYKTAMTALRKIASRSPLRARRLAKYGIEIE